MSASRYSESRTRVRYKETDQMGIAHHANYIVWFEIGRTDLCREAGLRYSEIERRGYLLVVSEVGCRYRTPYRYDEEIVLRTTIETINRRGIRFGYELLDGEGRAMHGHGFSSHIWLDRETRKPVVAPPELLEGFRNWQTSR